MNVRRIVAGVCVAVAALGYGGSVSAQSDILSERESVMRSNGMTLRAAMRASGDDATAAAQTFVDNFTRMPALFEDPEAQGEALPAVWEQNEEFLAIIAAGLEASEAALAAAQSGDQDGYVTALRQVGGSCQTCHETFRAD